MAYVITSLCQNAKECVEVCPVDAISDGGKQHYINPDLCIECGSCAAACTYEAIFQEEEVPAKYKDDVAKNAKFFA